MFTRFTPFSETRILRSALVFLLVLSFHSILAQAPRLNEFVFNHTGTDTNEYVEVFGSPNEDLSNFSILVIEGDGSGAGEIDAIVRPETTNSDGIWVSPFLDNIFENGTNTLLLVQGFTGVQGVDLDTDNDGILDITPWTSLVDGVAVKDGDSKDKTYGMTVLIRGYDGLSSSTVGGASRIPDGSDTDTAADWVRNDFDLAGLEGITGTPEEGEALNTPGSTNRGVGSTGELNLRINEFVFNHVDADTWEYVEVIGRPNADISEFALLHIEGDGSGAGTIDAIIQPGMTNAEGIWVSQFFENRFENGTSTLILVAGFMGVQGDDLDTNNDGILDFTPWTFMLDGIAVRDGDSVDKTYAETVLVRRFDDLNSTTVGGASRIPNGNDTDELSDWVRNDFDLAGLIGVTGTPEEGEAFNTPGRPNRAIDEAEDVNLKINEFVFSHEGTDEREYVEVFGRPNTNLAEFVLLQVEGDGGGAGVIDAIVQPGITDGNGIWVSDFLNNRFENGTSSLILVAGFSGKQGDDLDTNNDGILDVTPWTLFVDGVAVRDGDSVDKTYAEVVLVRRFDGLNGFTVGGASRIPDGNDTDSISDWVRNDVDLAGIPGFDGTPQIGEAFNTPGNLNQVVTEQPGMNEKNVKIYPNPAKSVIFVKTYDLDGFKGDFTIRNAQGHVVRKGTRYFKFKDFFTIYVGDLKSGTYYLEVVTNQHERAVERFVKK